VRPLLTRALRSRASSSDAPSISAPAADSQHQPAAVDAPSCLQRVRAKFLEDVQRHTMPCLAQAVMRHEDEVENGKRNTQRVRPLDRTMVSGSHEDSIQLQASTRASGQTTHSEVSGDDSCDFTTQGRPKLTISPKQKPS